MKLLKEISQSVNMATPLPLMTDTHPIGSIDLLWVSK